MVLILSKKIIGMHAATCDCVLLNMKDPSEMSLFFSKLLSVRNALKVSNCNCIHLNNKKNKTSVESVKIIQTILSFRKCCKMLTPPLDWIKTYFQLRTFSLWLTPSDRHLKKHGIEKKLCQDLVRSICQAQIGTSGWCCSRLSQGDW